MCSFGLIVAMGGLVSLPLIIAAPYSPSGGLDVNDTSPVYQPMSDFDYQSLNLGLYQEYIELDLFNYALEKFSPQELEAAGISASDQYLIGFMADQEVGHAIMISNILGPNNASKECTYTYPFNTVDEFITFTQQLTRWGESGVYGFLEHLNSRAAAQLLLESITVEARQEMIFRQFEGLFPMPFWFNPAITQSMQWTLLAPYITSCPAHNTRIQWQNFPALNVTNNPYNNIWNHTFPPAISTNHSALSSPDQTIYLSWESPGKSVGPNNSYITNTTAGPPQFVAWFSQLNVTYTPLTHISGNSGQTTQPGGDIYGDNTFSTYNGTIFVVVTDSNTRVTPANISFINEHIVAGPAVYLAG